MATPATAASPIAGTWVPAQKAAAIRPAGGRSLPFTPEGLAAFQRNQAGLKSGQLVDEASHLCLPEGMPRALASPYPFRIVDAPGTIAFLHEANREYRTVRMTDKHADAADWDPAFMGDPVGQWSGGTLVIDSTNFKADRIFLDATGVPVSDQLHLVERVRAIDGGNRLEIEVTVEDPKIFTRPWQARRVYERRDDLMLQTDWVCGEQHRSLSTLRRRGGPIARTAPAAAPTADQMALNGFWSGVPFPKGTPTDPWTATAEPLMKPAEAAFHRNYVAEEAAGRLQRTPKNLCLPSTMPGTAIPMALAYGTAILVQPDAIAFLYEENRGMRLVRMNGKHPRDLKPSWLGDAIGWWEGDTLVVDSIGFNDRNQLVDGLPVTHQLHVIERIRVRDGLLEISATFDDPGAFTAPFNVTARYRRSEPFQEFICAENNSQGGVPTASGVPTPRK